MRARPDIPAVHPSGQDNADPMAFINAMGPGDPHVPAGPTALAVEKPARAKAVEKVKAPRLKLPVLVHREQKLFRLPVALIVELRKAAYEKSISTGLRVTETDIVEQSLKDSFSKTA